MSKKKEFELPYVGIDNTDEDFHILYGSKGEPSVVIKITNSVVQFSANPSDYLDFHQTFLNIIKILGEGYFVQKLDILSKSVFEGDNSKEYLQVKYDEHFKGRVYSTISTYLVITKQVPKTRYVYNGKSSEEYKQHVNKVIQLLETNKFQPKLLRSSQIEALIDRTIAMDFQSKNIVLDNIKPTDTNIRLGDRAVKSLSLIDIDRIDLPEQVTPYVERNDKEALKGFPVDTMAFLHNVPDYETIIYNQVIEIPKQVLTIQKLELKKKRHSGIPDPANDMCVQDIDRLLEDVARENQLLVNAHFNIVVCAKDESLAKAVNYMENSLFTQGIIPSRNAYNQLELFRTVLAGNAVELKPYDLYLTTSDAALTFFFKEALPISETSPNGFFIRFTDRQGIPIKIDPADNPMLTGRINNRNKFVLGPSGSGKSFFMNALIEQYLLYNMDVVIVDTGDSYSGTSSYYGGRYITYKPEKPITMNPFAMKESEYNLEKKDFLQTLVSLLWKGANGSISQVEADVISDVISAYYHTYFSKKSEDWVNNSSIAELEAHLHEHGINTQLLLESAKLKFKGSNKWTKDYYAVLQVNPSATHTEIKTAFRKLALIHHPDKGTSDNPNDGVIFSEITEAYELLSNRELRKTYDEINNIGKLAKIGANNPESTDDETSALTKHYAEILRKTALECDREHRIDNLSFNSFYEFALFKIPIIKEKEHIQFDVDEFRFVLKKFYKGGEFDSILNESADNSLFDERLIVFEIDNIKEHKILFPIVTLIIMDVFLQKMRWRQGQRKALIIEEAWKAIASPMMAGYILYLYKTVRKFLGEAIVVTQELGDIIGNTIVKDSIVNNSDTICLLDQTKFKDNYEQIANLLSINEVERKKIFTINNLDNKENRGRFKEVYIRRGATGEVYGVEVSLQQYLTYTTEKPEKLAIESYARLYGSYPDGLDAFVQHMKMSGLPLPSFVKLVNTMKEALTHDAATLLYTYRKADPDNGIAKFQSDFLQSDLPLTEWVSANNIETVIN